ncbi:hypothetical protein LSM04_005380 [Trypanosoma melophagium]|uniref:uncharacterized protein n=1 Tax=Trypanosoma melophagium TaxID=715481 RepID=UPI003519DB2F|nr:hypothetical protein LSM04_005380 [Trypanosoma melophagium]
MMRLTRVFAVAARRAPVRPVDRPPLMTNVFPAAVKTLKSVKTAKAVKKTARPQAANTYARFYAALCAGGAVRGRDGMRTAGKLWRATWKVKGLKNRVAAALKLSKHKGVKAAKPKKSGKKLAKKHVKKVKKVKAAKSKAALRKAVKKATKKKAAKRHVKKVNVSIPPVFH